MQNLKLTALLLLSIAALTACGNGQPTKMSANSNVPNIYPNSDIYDMTYKICGESCEVRTSKIVTWGKPTEIGIGYYELSFPESVDGFKKIEQMKDRKYVTLLVKCKGTLPGVEKPIDTERFVPVEHFPSSLLNPFTKVQVVPNSSVQIISITKLDRSDKESPDLTARTNLKAKIRDENMIEGRIVDGYLSWTSQKPELIAQLIPQQIEEITWKEGQQPQVITLKAW
jgi:hypothetical protein